MWRVQASRHTCALYTMVATCRARFTSRFVHRAPRPLHMKSIAERIADELNVRAPQVVAAIALLDDKATVPFVARYRKEATCGLDDTQLRALEERLAYLRDMEDRRTAILASIEEQGKLTPELAASIRDAVTKARLEDLSCPTSGSDGPKLRSRVSPAWSRLPRVCSMIPRSIPMP